MKSRCKWEVEGEVKQSIDTISNAVSLICDIN